MKKFEIIDIAGDIGIKAHGNNKKEAFANVGLGLYEIMTGSVVKGSSEEIVIDMFSNDYEELLVDYLNELIFNFQVVKCFNNNFCILRNYFPFFIIFSCTYI